MSDEEVSPGSESVAEFLYDFLLCFPVEVDEYVSAEDDVELFFYIVNAVH